MSVSGDQTWLKNRPTIIRDLLVQRAKLGVEISRFKNSLIGYLKREGVYDSLPKTSDSFSINYDFTVAVRGITGKLHVVIESLQFLEPSGTIDRKFLMASVIALSIFASSSGRSFLGDVTFNMPLQKFWGL